MHLETILSGTPELNEETSPVIHHLIDIRRRALVNGDLEAVIEELRWYMSLHDQAESIPEEERIRWKELHREYRDLSDDQIEDLIHAIEKSEYGNFINQ